MNWMNIVPLPIAYLLGSISSAYIIAKFSAKIDIRDEADGHISAAAVYRRVGLTPFIIVVTMDISKAALAVLVAQWMGATPVFVMLAGVCAIVAHQWSPFLKFQGGLGATTIAGVLVAVATIPTFIGAAIAALFAYMTKRSSLSFGIGMLVIATVLFAMQWSTFTMPLILIALPSVPPPLTSYHILIAYPLILGLMQAIKFIQIKYRPGEPI